MTKKNFETLEIEIVTFDAEDIVRMSDTQSGDYIGGGSGGIDWDD